MKKGLSGYGRLNGVKGIVRAKNSSSSSVVKSCGYRSFSRTTSNYCVKFNNATTKSLNSDYQPIQTYLNQLRRICTTQVITNTVDFIQILRKTVRVASVSTVSFLIVSFFSSYSPYSLTSESKRKLISYSPTNTSYSFSPSSSSSSSSSPSPSPSVSSDSVLTANTLTFQPSTSSIKVATSLYSNPIDTLLSRLSTSNASVQAVVYKFDNDQIYTSLSALLQRGISVQLICDLSQNKKQKSLAYKLRSEGAKVQFWDVTGIGKKLHAKFTIVDGEWVMSGSSNWTKNADGDNMELLLEFEGGNNVQEFRSTFDEMWRLAKHDHHT